MAGTEQIFPVTEAGKRRARINASAYSKGYERSLRDPEGFWAEQATRLDWHRKPSKIRDVSYGPQSVHIRWFEDGVLNASSVS